MGNSNKLYKILVECTEGDKKVYHSPYQNYRYGTAEEMLGKKWTAECKHDANGCGPGLYATGIEGLIYTNLAPRDGGRCVVWETEMSGKEHFHSIYKRSFPEQEFKRIVPMEEVKESARKYSADVGWDYCSLLFPTFPLREDVELKDEHVEWLREWDSVQASVQVSVRDSVRDSVWDYVWDSVRDSVWVSVWDSVQDSVWDSVQASVQAPVDVSLWAYVEGLAAAYISTAFPNIKWKGFEEKENPFQSGINLWNAGIVPSFDGETWRLHTGKRAKVIFETDKL